MNIFAQSKSLLMIISLLPLNQAGLKRTIASEKGKVVIVNMWATWCAPFKAEMPALISFERQHPGQKVKLILLSANELEEKKAAEAFLERSGFGSVAYTKQDKDDQQFIQLGGPHVERGFTRNLRLRPLREARKIFHRNRRHEPTRSAD